MGFFKGGEPDLLMPQAARVAASGFVTALKNAAPPEAFEHWQQDAERATERRLEARRINELTNEEESLP